MRVATVFARGATCSNPCQSVHRLRGSRSHAVNPLELPSGVDDKGEVSLWVSDDDEVGAVGVFPVDSSSTEREASVHLGQGGGPERSGAVHVRHVHDRCMPYGTSNARTASPDPVRGGSRIPRRSAAAELDIARVALGVPGWHSGQPNAMAPHSGSASSSRDAGYRRWRSTCISLDPAGKGIR
jgi:hypothetical protein